MSMATFFNSYSNAQSIQHDYYVYYRLLNQAEIKEFEGDTIDALNIYIKAFNNFKGFETDYIHPIKLALKLKKYKQAYYLLRQKAIHTGWYSSDDLFHKQHMDGFLKSKYGKCYNKNFKKWLVTNESTYNIKYLQFISAINESDQLVRDGKLRILKPYLSNDSIYGEVRSRVISYIDSVNFLRFKKFTTYNGFPSRSQLGGKELSHTFIVHTFKYVNLDDFKVEQFEKEKYIYLDSLLRKQIRLGEFQPSSFAYCIDYSLSADSMTLFGYPIYFRGKDGIEFMNFPLIDPENVNKRRLEIGLMPIEIDRKIKNLPLPPNFILK